VKKQGASRPTAVFGRTKVRSIDHQLPLGKRAPPAAWEVSIEVLIPDSREEARRAHVSIFGFHAEKGDVVIDLNVEYFWEIVLTKGANVPLSDGL
jgi:hypothetical protein